MAKSPLSADVQAANSKLAQFLRRQQEEEMILQIGKRKPKLERDEVRLPGGRARWAMEPDYKAPSPLIDRPRTAAGATSFHFSYIPVNKTASPTVGGQPLEGRVGRAKTAALDHSKYIERDGAAEVSRGAQHAAYVERDDVVEHAASRMAADPRGVAEGLIGEAPTTDEVAIMGDRPEFRNGVPSIFSNISEDPFERQEFWRAVERIEREPKVHELLLDPEILPAWWAELRHYSFPDAGFKEHALQVQAAYQDYLASPDAERGKKPFKAKPFISTAERAGKIIAAARGMAKYDERLSPLEFKSGRGGRTQIRFVAELPYEISAEDRALIVQNFCDYLGNLEQRSREDGTVGKVGLMYTAVIHAPDAHNDSRNYHLHIVAYDRPARFIPEEGLWDFEYAEHFDHKGEARVRHPFRQNKIEDPTRGDKRKERRWDENFVKRHRMKFAEITNRVLKARGVQRRIDARRYTEMGIDRTPTEHLGTKAAALESIGVPTTVGKLNAIAIWSDAERSIERQAKESEKAYKTTQHELDNLARTVGRVDPAHPAMTQYRALTAERARLVESVADDRREIMTFDHLEAKAKSRAIRTRQTCLQYLTDIQKGRADLNTRIMRQAIQDRWQGAQNHINDIDAALAPHRPALAAAARNVEDRERRIREINELLEPLKTVLEERLGMSTLRHAFLDGEVPAPLDTRRRAQSSTGASPASIDADAESPRLPADSSVVAPVDAGTASATPPVANQLAEPVTEPANPPFVAIDPASIEGLPIVQPTIGPRQDLDAPLADDPQATPVGLDPLREHAPSPAGEMAPEVIIPDLNNPEAPAFQGPSEPTNVVDPRTLETPSTIATSIPGSDPSETPARTDQAAVHGRDSLPADRPEEKVDRRRRQADPTLFELPDQTPPVKPGTTRAEYADWDALIKRIADQRIPVKQEKLPNGAFSYSAPALDRADQLLLRTPRFAARTNGRLGSVYERQQHEVQRLVRWIQTQGQDPTALSLEGRTVELGKEARQAVRTLFRNWGRAPAVIEALRHEHARRAELAKTAPHSPTPALQATPNEGGDRATRKEEASRIYPTPDQAHTPQVAEFIRLLREIAPDEQLRRAAERIYDDPAAREDVNYHTVDLATAYNTYRDDADEIARGIGRDRDRER
ncbi:MobA/MobL family protein [Sphingosinicella sp. BN140058]|uniref:MobA/MobL family protein n=1 Tax=Sphingosinicella sp. BN140058 TaxID=1892855 RepID=UPI001010C8EF|nr:MobA/MobL family protein [Sphingosinicella sp. BN140058]QAY80220.1 hypothetical protein ETR14_26620 [Sphingosinicella sp. BN140058]